MTLDNWLKKHIAEVDNVAPREANQTPSDEADNEPDHVYPLHPVVQSFNDENREQH